MHIHTVDPPPADAESGDWPAMLGSDSLFDSNARTQCPKSHARRTLEASYGLPATPDFELRRPPRGCGVAEEKWTCSLIETPRHRRDRNDRLAQEQQIG